MSTLDLPDLKALALSEGKRLGWKRFGDLATVDGETLRQFAVDPKRGAQPSTLAALRRYFSRPSASDVQAKAEQALALIQQGQALLQEVVRLLPADDDTLARIAAADDPTLLEQPDGGPAARTEATVGAARRRHRAR